MSRLESLTVTDVCAAVNKARPQHMAYDTLVELRARAGIPDPAPPGQDTHDYLALADACGNMALFNEKDKIGFAWDLWDWLKRQRAT